jgi:hypothetical protein
MCLQYGTVSNKQIKLPVLFVVILKTTEEKSRIRT